MEVPFGHCHCGCGEKTRLHSKHEPRHGNRKGEPRKWLPGHHRRQTPHDYVVAESGCWEWVRYIDPKTGYGHAQLAPGVRTTAHRVYYEKHVGPIPEGLDIDHLCRNRKCVNPDHLEPVTRAENLRRGERTILTLAEARAIRAHPDGHAAVAREYGVSPELVSGIRHGRKWREAA